MTDEPLGDPAAQLRGTRYQTIRAHLGEATKRGNLTNDTYLLAQIALILCDVLDGVDAGLQAAEAIHEEIRQLRVDMEVRGK